MNAEENTMLAREIFSSVKVVPVIIIDELEDAAPLAESLISGGLHVLEVTLRTDNALEAISKMSAAQPSAFIGAGTLLTAQDVKNVKEAGARFGVSPGATDEVLEAALEYELPILPGAVTASEVMYLLSKGFSMLKFFPAEIAGGAKMLKAFSSPFKEAKFCPTGGISKDNANEYLNLPNVVCVGGSWVCDQELVKTGSWGEIALLASEASKL